MAGRPKSFDMDAALEAFVDVFWTKGYQGTSIDDLQRAAGIKRGSFYAAFGCKDDVFATVLNKYWKEATEHGLDHLKTEADPRRAVAQLIRHVGLFMSRNTPRGCLLLTSSANPVSETGHTSPVVRERMNVLEDRIFNALHRQNGTPVEKDARELATFSLSCLLGLNALARNG
ncbi:TetR/AcrR family transcriptional regulator, partial [Labrenzia sp. DG1229]|uniref:TetR/AcrR family transcriptional regulator n=1 Tax=Labrenzia sp. DG1229 TaxID=681847 RepID=UPI00155DB83A